MPCTSHIIPLVLGVTVFGMPHATAAQELAATPDSAASPAAPPVLIA